MEYAELLLKFGAELDAIDEEYRSTPLGWAAKFGQTEMVRFLLDKEANPHLPAEEAWAQPLAWAERKGHADIAMLLKNL
jgi:ankyrin repeat protein